MAFYLWSGSYTTDAIKGLVDEPQNREAMARAAIEAVGGKLHHYFFCLGQQDIIVIMEFDDDVSMTALSMLVGSLGSFAHGATTKLLTSADAVSAMAAAKEARARYAPPSG